MPELIFIEGVSGVGKSTLTKMLAEDLRALGYSVREYIEFDYTNPIDFYCTAYFSLEEYNSLCAAHLQFADLIRENSVCAGNAMLVRYYNQDVPLFSGPLLSDLAQHEFCYHPKQLISLEEYSAAYEAVWRNWAANLDDTYDFLLFDGSLLHHPINDMMRNYGVDGEGGLPHILTLLRSLGQLKRHIFYIKTNQIGEQLTKAHLDRNQDVPTEKQINFWEQRYQNDQLVLQNLPEKTQVFDVSSGNWDAVRDRIVEQLTQHKRKEQIQPKPEKRARPALFALLAAVLVLCAAIVFEVYQTTTGARLSEAQIAALRESYPVCGDIGKIPQNIDRFGFPTWEEIKERSDTFLYATIDGEWSKYFRTYGLYGSYSYEYPITVIEDTEGCFEPGEMLTIASNLSLLEYNPDLKPGMKIIFPVSLEFQEETRLYFSVEGMYYVTEDDYVLSAFDEDKHAVKQKMTGKKLRALMREVKK